MRASSYMADRLETRLDPPDFGALKSWNPIFICVRGDDYTQFYGDEMGIEIISKLRRQAAKSLGRFVSATDAGPGETAQGLNTGLEAEPSSRRKADCEPEGERRLRRW
jgi:hypothetical protein